MLIPWESSVLGMREEEEEEKRREDGDNGYFAKAIYNNNNNKFTVHISLKHTFRSRCLSFQQLVHP